MHTRKIASCFLYPVIFIHGTVIDPVKKRLWGDGHQKNREKEHQQLCEENEALRAENILLRATQLYHHDTAELSAFKKRYDMHNSCIFSILARHLSAKNQFFLVNAGTWQGIE